MNSVHQYTLKILVHTDENLQANWNIEKENEKQQQQQNLDYLKKMFLWQVVFVSLLFVCSFVLTPLHFVVSQILWSAFRCYHFKGLIAKIAN